MKLPGIFNTVTFFAAAAAADKKTNNLDDAGLRGAKLEVPLVSDAADATSPKERQVIEDRQVGPTLGEATTIGPSDDLFPRSFRFVLSNQVDDHDLNGYNFFYRDNFLDVCGEADGGHGVQTTDNLDRNNAHQTSTWEWRRWICGTDECVGDISHNDSGWLYNPVYGYLAVSGDKVITKANVGWELESIWQMQKKWYEYGNEISAGDSVHIYNYSNYKYLNVDRIRSTCAGRYTVSTEPSENWTNEGKSGTWQILELI